MTNATYLAHHGIKGQKWGVRRFQNPDGSFTDEGRRRYGYGKGSYNAITENTAQAISKGINVGIGAGIGTGLVTTAAIAGLVGPSMAIPLGAAYIADNVVGGAIRGAVVGGIVGAISTKRGRAYIEKHDKDLKAFEMRDFD